MKNCQICWVHTVQIQKSKTEVKYKYIDARSGAIVFARSICAGRQPAYHNVTMVLKNKHQLCLCLNADVVASNRHLRVIPRVQILCMRRSVVLSTWLNSKPVLAPSPGLALALLIAIMRTTKSWKTVPKRVQRAPFSGAQTRRSVLLVLEGQHATYLHHAFCVKNKSYVDYSQAKMS